MFIIFGTPRSGTTILAQCLNAHPQVCIPIETDFIVPLAFIYNRIRDPELGKNLIIELITHSVAYQASLGAYLTADSLAGIVRSSKYQPGAILEGIYTAIAQSAGVKIAGDKSPNDLDYIKILVENDTIIPSMKIIHIVRDVRDLMVSLNRTGWLPDADLYFPRFWCSNNLYLYAKYSDSPKRYLLLRYEDMVQEPKNTFDELCNFLEIPFNPVMLSPENRNLVYRDLQPNVLKPIFTDSVGAYRKLLDQKTLDLYNAQAAEALNTFRYPLDIQKNPLTSKDEIHALEKRLADLQSRMPAHSIPPGMIAELDALEDQLQAARHRLEATPPPTDAKT